MRISREFCTTGRKWAAIGLAAFVFGSCRSAAPKPAATDDEGPEQNSVAAIGPTRLSNRLVFPWSVVSGGVDSPLAMRTAMQEDPVVEGHYAGLNPASFRAEVLPAKRQGYVSYRIRDKIYWTRLMVTVQAGEKVLTDGKFLVRGRCGNLISATPREPVAPGAMEPKEPTMDRPVPEAQLMYSPPLPADPITETGSLRNPKQIGTDHEMTTVLSRPDSQEMLPPVWTAGGRSTGFGGVIGTTGGGGTAGTPPVAPDPPGMTVPEIAIPGASVVPVWTYTPPIEIAPPLVIASLLPPPGAPTNAVLPEYIWLRYIGEHPPTLNYPPGLTTPPPYSPPQISYPPSIVPPPSPPPPGTPPLSDPPPSDPPPKDPPVPGPRSSPPDSPPEDFPIPEPGPWILFALGLAGLAVGTVRRKY